jgi:hypothetical protein
MASKTIQVDKIGLAAVKPLSDQFFKLGQTEAMLAIQKELLEAYAQANSAWLARVKTEADFWSGLATRLTATRSVPEALGAYQECADANGC